MAKSKRTQPQPARRPPKVRIACPVGRPFQLRYTDEETKREVRISTGSRDEEEAENQKKLLEAKLLLGEDAKPKKRITGPNMAWEDFRDEYTRLKVATFRTGNGKETAEGRLDVCQRILKPKRLRDAISSDTLSGLQAELLAGSEGKRPRTAHTVESYMRTFIAALNWAYKIGWLPARIRCDVIKTDKLELMKGRPLSEAEFLRILAACDTICAPDPDSWRFLLRGLWESGLRLSEAFQVSWDRQGTIRPVEARNGAVLLQFPANKQKNRRDQTIPTIPAFAGLLETVPLEERTGWIFKPCLLKGQGRPTDMRHVGKIITRIGKEAKVFVNDQGKPASAHDLRRSFGQRMADAGIPPRGDVL